MDQAIQREVARTPVSFRKTIQEMAERINFAGHGDAHDQLFLFIGQVFKRKPLSDKPGVCVGQGLFMIRIHEQSVQDIQKVITGRPVNRPALRQRFALAQDFFHYDVERLCRLRGIRQFLRRP